MERSLAVLLFSYAALVPVQNLTLPSDIPFDVAHEFFSRKLLSDHHLEHYPPSQSYQQSFWKWALVRLENLSRSVDDEIDERIYTHYLSLRTGLRSEAPADSFITHYWKFPDVDAYETATLFESRTIIEVGTTGLRTWRASLVLAQYLIQHPDLVSTCNVLELGSGTGFIGILVAGLQLHVATTPDRGLPFVCLTDVNSAVLARCQSNARLPCNKSSTHPNIDYKSLDWLDSLSDQESLRSFFSETKADIVLGADVVRISPRGQPAHGIWTVVFDPMLIPPLVKTIYLALSCKRVQLALIALTARNEETLAYFLDEIGKVSKTVEVAHDIAGNPLLQIPDPVDAELAVRIFKVTRTEDT